MLIRCEMLKKLANAFIEVAKEENLPVNITMGRSYTDSGGSRQVGIILEASCGHAGGRLAPSGDLDGHERPLFGRMARRAQ